VHRSDQPAADWRHRHPTPKALLSGGLLVAALALPHPGGVIVACLALGVTLGPAQVRARQLWRAARAPLLFVAIAALTVAPRVSASATGVTFDGLELDAVWPLFTRSVGALAAMLLLTLGTPAADLLRVLHRLGLPVAVAEVGLGMLRLLDVLGEERERMQQVTALRGGRVDAAARRRSAAAVATGLFRRGLRRADRLELALQLRSPGGLIATQPAHGALRRQDLVAAAVVATIPILLWWGTR
jgi:cobalt/nickel transport system permease protein